MKEPAIFKMHMQAGLVLTPEIAAFGVKRRLTGKAQLSCLDIGKPVVIGGERGHAFEMRRGLRLLIGDHAVDPPAAPKVFQVGKSHTGAAAQGTKRAKRLIPGGLSCRAAMGSLGGREDSASQPRKGSPA